MPTPMPAKPRNIQPHVQAKTATHPNTTLEELRHHGALAGLDE